MKLSSLLLFIILFSALACQSVSNKRRATEQYYTSSGVEKFFLSDIPEWLNYSKSGQCVRESSVRFVDYPKLIGQFSFSYQQATQFQYLLNKLRREKMTEVRSNYLLLRDEEIVFYDTIDKIQNGIYAFESTRYKRVHLIWIDPAMRSEESMLELKKVLASEKMNQGYPVLVSLCLDYPHLKDFVNKSKLYDGIGMIPFDLFSVYGEDKKHTRRFSLNFSLLFSQDQELHLFLPKGEVKPEEFVGNLATENY